MPTLTAEMFERICRIMKVVETTDPKEGFTTTVGTALSTMPEIR